MYSPESTSSRIGASFPPLAFRSTFPEEIPRPSIYYPDVSRTSTVRTTPAVSFSKTSRTQSSRVLIGRYYNADSIGRESPGPIYNYTNDSFSRRKRGGVAEFKRAQEEARRAQEIREQRTQLLSRQNLLTDGGPASYKPNLNAVKPSSVMPSIGTAPRFPPLPAERENKVDSTGSSPSPSSAYHIDAIRAFSRTKPAPPSFSFRSSRQIIDLSKQKGGYPGEYDPHDGPAAYNPDFRLVKKAAPAVGISRTPRFPVSSIPVPPKGDRDRVAQLQGMNQRSDSYRITTRWM